ncbi:MAG: carboxypeptidase M32 [Chloroflexota bacterium]
MSEKMTRLKALLAEVSALRQAQAVISWDFETQMPEGGATAHGNQLAVLAGIEHSRFTSEEIGKLLDDVSVELDGADPDSDDVRLVQVTKHDYDRACRVPAELVDEQSRAASEAVVVWQKARKESDFKSFAPYLKRNMDITRRLAEAYGYKDRAYDAFVDLFEPGMDSAQLDSIFADLKAAIVPLVQEISARQDAVDDSILHQEYDPDTQLRVSLDIAQQYGYDLKRGRLDKSAHPFCTSMGMDDVRITTRVIPNFLNACLFAVLHESGHAMYEQGVSHSLAGTPLETGTSAGVHESQSRLWENLVGRSRPMQDFLFPRLQQAYPSQLGDADVETFYRAINRVSPSYIRVEADEVTYNLHILMRYELENDMLEGKVDIETLDEVWNERFEQYFGLTPPRAAAGVLQDIHWAWGGPYIFPSYTLGNVIGAQLFAQAHKDMPNLDDDISRGHFSDLLQWLQTNVYQHGRKFNANELAVRITGEPVNTRAWIEYVRGKFRPIYGI